MQYLCQFTDFIIRFELTPMKLAYRITWQLSNSWSFLSPVFDCLLVCKWGGESPPIHLHVHLSPVLWTILMMWHWCCLAIASCIHPLDRHYKMIWHHPTFCLFVTLLLTSHASTPHVSLPFCLSTHVQISPSVFADYKRLEVGMACEWGLTYLALWQPAIGQVQAQSSTKHNWSCYKGWEVT